MPPICPYFFLKKLTPPTHFSLPPSLPPSLVHLLVITDGGAILRATNDCRDRHFRDQEKLILDAVERKTINLLLAAGYVFPPSLPPRIVTIVSSSSSPSK